MYWVDFNFVKVVEDRLIISIDVPVVAQRAEKSILTVVSSRHDALWEVHDPLFQKVVRGIQTTHKFWGEGKSLGLARHSRDGWPQLTKYVCSAAGTSRFCKRPDIFSGGETRADLTVPQTSSLLGSLQHLFSSPLLPSYLSSSRSRRD